MHFPASNLFISLIFGSLLVKTSASSHQTDNVIAKGLRGGQRTSPDRWSLSERVTAEVQENGEKCSLDASVSCQVHHGEGIVEACEDFSMPLLTVGACEQTPLTTTLLYNGGDCSQTDNRDVLQIQCQDGSTPPPTVEGVQSYIVVTDAKGQGITYYEGWVEVGSIYVLDSGSEMSYGFEIYIYSTADRTELLQKVLYSSILCSSNLEFLNRFGASQIIEYTNEEQGIVSAFATFSYDVTVDLTFKLMGAPRAYMNAAAILSNFASFVELSSQVQGQIIEVDSPVTVTLPVSVDLTEPRRNTMLVQASASLDGSSLDNDCTLTAFFSFTTGGRKQG